MFQLSTSTPTYCHIVTYTPLDNGTVQIKHFQQDSLADMDWMNGRVEILPIAEAREHYREYLTKSSYHRIK